MQAAAHPAKAAEMAAYHKVDRPYLGISVPQIEDLTDAWRGEMDVRARVDLARGLWDSNIHEARVAACKLLTQARMKEGDTPAFDLICTWAPQFDAWALADHACIALQKRLVADPARLDVIEEWTASPLMWMRRAALVATLPWAKLNNLKPHDHAIRERVLDWAALYVPDRDWFMQKVVAWWLRDLSKHDAARTAAFLAEHGLAATLFSKYAAQYSLLSGKRAPLK
ncbi:MAG: DNA alkylation repair protein [Cypionkella sp.]|nr:DNA alkylation repair protein [Cypionkella sp.]